MEKLNDNNLFNKRFKGFGFGIFVIVIGFVLLGLNFGLIDEKLRWIIFSWPSIIIFIGLMQLSKARKIFWGVMLMVVGAFFLLPRIVETFPDKFPAGLADNFTSAYWPVILILFGLTILLEKFFFPQKNWKQYVSGTHSQFHTHSGSGNTAYKWEKKPGAFEKNSIFGGGEHIILDPGFKGGEINAIFGGMTLDLRRSSLSEGETVLDVNAVFGGVTLLIPGDWYVETRMDTVFGGFEDKRIIQEPVDHTRKLILTGSCVFGGGEMIS
jgi:predicted membrane protein